MPAPADKKPFGRQVFMSGNKFVTRKDYKPEDKTSERALAGNRTFGKHMMLDFSGCDEKKLNDLDLCFSLLNDLPEKIRMNKISAPHVIRYSPPSLMDQGITGMVVIAESHISLHTFPLRKYVFIDIFSCKDFDNSFALNFFKEAFNPSDYDCFMQDRGKHFFSN